MMQPTPRRVCVWREDLLPGSETFILNQVRSFRRWSALLTGVRRYDSALEVTPDFTIQGNPAIAHRLDRRVYWNTGTSIRVHRHLRSTSLVHAHFGPDGTHIARAARLARRPLIVTFHGYDVTTSQSGLGVSYSTLFERAERLLAVSEFIRVKLLQAGAPDEKITVLPIGIPLSPDYPRKPTGEHLLFVGRLTPQKGCADLLEALSGISEAPPLVVIGDGPLRGDLEHRAQRLGVKASFIGARGPEDVARAMASSIALCVPSKAEGLGMVFLEAAAARLPVVSYASGGITEAVADGETGLLAPEGDIRALAEHLGRVAGDAELASRLGAAGRRRVEAQFDIRQRAARLEELYDEIADGEEPTASQVLCA
jgi:colanic acid/amylovoran biosynthesis glycosyltransferase